MQSKMSALTCSYLDSRERVKNDREEIVRALRDAHRTHWRCRTERDIVIRAMQRDFYRLVLADKLREIRKYAALHRQELVGEADRILDKRVNAERVARPPRDMRTPREEQMYGALRVQWFELMKLAGIEPPSRASRW